MKILNTYIYSHDAHLDLAKLTDSGVYAEIIDDNIVSMAPYLSNAVGGIKLIVDDVDFERASLILQENSIVDLQDELDDKTIALNICPKCSSSNIVRKKSIISAILFLLFFWLPFATLTKKMICLNCDNTWSI